MHAQESLDDLARRFREAGSRYPDVRSPLWHGLKGVPRSQLLKEFGELFCTCLFRPDGSTDDFWELAHFRENVATDPANPFRGECRPTGDSFIESIDALDDSSRPICERIRSLGREAIYLAQQFGVASVPGADQLNIGSLDAVYATWYLLVHHAAWARPPGSTLTGGKHYPAGMMAEAEHRAAILDEIGPVSWAEADNAIAKRNKQKGRDAVSLESMKYYDRHCAMKRERVEAGDFISMLSMDPFTASAQLLTIIRRGTREAPPVNNAPEDDVDDSAPARVTDLMRVILAQNQESLEWSQKKWAEELGVTRSAISQTESWATIMKLRDSQRLEKLARSKPR